MTRKLALLAAVALALPAGGLAGVAQADEHRLSSMQAGRFGAICSKPQGKAVCDAYIAGMADSGALSALNAKSNGDSGTVVGFCVPDAETTDAMRSKVLSWLKAHQDVLKFPVGKSVFAALHEAYPCSGQGGKP
ncbi:Rap1a/Tai family immunity protein [Asaia bogorensis]|uniref:Rap1a/Tai family immunity protein n=1 Tax=Asaia bogorensis TaxID=91915 RepID=UPI000EFB7BA5|nr:Rap1a/Tai family immunity protein [Asaia bogorensis]